MEKIIEIGAELILFLVASYFIFYKAWLKSLGTEVAKLSTAEDLTKIQETVKSDFNTKIEELKSTLSKNNISYQIQYSHLHQERSKAIVELYRKLQELHSAMVDFTATMKPVIEDADKEEEERNVRANKALMDFKNYYILNKVFFDKIFCKYVDEVFKVYWDKGWEFGFKSGRMKSGQLGKEDFKDYLSETSAISKEIRDELPHKIEEIETEIRKMLGVEE